MAEYKLPVGAPEEETELGEPKPVGFVQRELKRLASELAQPQTPEVYAQLYAAQQALAWAIEPGGFSSPTDLIDEGLIQPLRDTQEDSADCWAARRRSRS